MSRLRALSHRAELSARGPSRFIGSLEKMLPGRCWLGNYYSAFICFSREIRDGKTKCSFGNKLGSALIQYTGDDRPVCPVSLMKPNIPCTREAYSSYFENNLYLRIFNYFTDIRPVGR